MRALNHLCMVFNIRPYHVTVCALVDALQRIFHFSYHLLTTYIVWHRVPYT